jgi:PhnB protein
MRLATHVSFDGQCEEAFLEYQRVLGGSIGMMLRYGDSPMAAEVETQWHGRIVHASLQVGDFELAGADVMPADYQKPQGFAVILNVYTLEKAQQVYDALSIGGETQMPLQPTFWSSGYAQFTDRFGTPWEINCG